MKAALDWLPEQVRPGEQLPQLQHFQRDNRSCSGIADNPHADSQPLGLMALVDDCVDSTGSNAHALAPTIPKHFVY
jgi:hypothetical protein